MEVLQSVKILPSFVLVLLQEHLEPSRCLFWKWRQFFMQMYNLGHHESTFLRILSGPSSATSSKAPIIPSRRGRSSRTRGPVITWAGSYKEGTHPLKEQENAGLSVFLYWTLMSCRMCHWPHEAGYRFDNRQIIESSLDSSLRTKPGLEARRRASTGSVCGSILTSSSLAAASLLGQTCNKGFLSKASLFLNSYFEPLNNVDWAVYSKGK